ncbi:peptidoglycan D,D-transpeptidase FtsI family protein [Tsuneonella mangrovi]|uniref:peptidoglycan D,D-transpeptidase FtsI family protein n=1 Tax=Tsuneonella mangrovi TaxID=1982042 RepID=UPI000BA20EE4|nr:penicillin-binding protein 2 [Tsuneonella mangrovi]
MTAISVSTAISSGRVHLVTQRRRQLTVARLRVLLVAGLFVAIAIAALGRIGYLGLDDHSTESTSLVDALLPPRGEITDRNGQVLARAFPAFALWYDPGALAGGSPLVKSPKVVAADLKAIFPDMNEAKVEKKLAAGRGGYLERRILPEQANKVLAIGEPALELPKETQRYYPQGSLAAHVLGFVNANGNGKLGMEQTLDARLKDPAKRGTPVELSIDTRVQGALEDELGRGMKMVNAMGGAGIVLDVDTGEVLAMASLPEFDPNNVKPSDLLLTKAEAAEGKFPTSFNRITNQVYELGSTFKPITIAAAIDAGVVRDFGKKWDAEPIKMGGFTIKDLHNMGDSLNVPETLIHSSNTVSARIADTLGGARMRQTLIDLGMNKRPEIELPARGFPIWPGKDWPRLRTMTVGFGHGVAVTPLHLASAYAALVNGGIWRPSTLYKLKPGEAPRGHRVFKASTSARMRQLLRMVALYGTGRGANAPGFRVGGKTGSAEKPGAHGYRHHSLVSTFAAAFPMDHPRYVVIAMLDEPKGTAASSYQRTAAWNAVPIVGRLIPRIGPMLGIPPDTSRDVDLSDLDPLVPESEGGKAAAEGE